MSSNLVVGIVGMVLFLVLLAPAEHELKKLTRRHVDRSRRVVRAAVFFAGMATWAAASYMLWYRLSREWWFVAFLIAAAVWKLVVDVLIFGASDQPDSGNPRS